MIAENKKETITVNVNHDGSNGQKRSNNNNNQNKNKNNNNNNNKNKQNNQNGKRKANKQRKSQALQQARGNSALAQVNPAVKELAQNFMLPEKSFAVPRIVPTKVGFKNFKASFQLPIGDTQTKAAYVVRPDPKQFLEILTEVDEQINFNYHNVISETGILNPVTVDTDIKTSAGKTVRSSTFKGVTDYVHFSDREGKMLPGAKYYPGFVDWGTVAELRITDTNSTKFRTAGTMKADLFYVRLVSGQQTLVSAGTESVAVEANNTMPLIVLEIDGNMSPGDLGFMILMTYSVPLYQYGQILCTFEFTKAGGEPGDFAILTGGWSSFTLWDLIGPQSRSSKLQFDSCDKWVVTGLNCLLQNATATIYKSGDVFAARMPGGFLPPSEFLSVFETLASYVSGPAYKGLLEKGMDWFYTPQRLEDLQFNQTPSDNGLSENPFLMTYLQWQQTAGSPQPSLWLNFWINIEYLSTDMSLTYKTSPAIFGLYEAFVSSLIEVQPFSENPEHLKNIARQVQKVVTSPQLRSVLKTAISVGVKVAPFVLSLL